MFYLALKLIYIFRMIFVSELIASKFLERVKFGTINHKFSSNVKSGLEIRLSNDRFKQMTVKA